MLAPARHALPIGGLDPVDAAPLADAGVTPMHAISTVPDRLTPGSTTVVIGLGGLGHMGVQILAASTGTRIIALDVDPAKTAAATALGAHLALPSDPSAVERILAETGGYGADVVLGFVGVPATLDLAARTVAPEGAVRLIGLGGGELAVAASGAGGLLPWASTFSARTAAPSRTSRRCWRWRSPAASPCTLSAIRSPSTSGRSTTSKPDGSPAAPCSSPDQAYDRTRTATDRVSMPRQFTQNVDPRNRARRCATAAHTK